MAGFNASANPELKGKMLCKECFSKTHSTINLPQTQSVNYSINNQQATSPTQSHIALSPEVNNAILWQRDEIPLEKVECQEFFEDCTVYLGARVGHKGHLVVTNQRLLFVCKLGFLAKDYAVMYGITLENIINVSQGRFGFNNKLVILENNNQHKDFVRPNIQSIIPIINSAITSRKNVLMAEKQKEHVQIILDFSSLKDVMFKGGLVMTTYKCPNCSGILKLPEEGKILMCEYCGTPIKPVDIFEKIKSLIT